MLTPDLNETRKFLKAMGLSDTDSLTFQTFDDSEAKRPGLARIIHGPLKGAQKKLIELNGRGAGIFWTVNETDLKGRKSENITKVRAVFVDLDGAPLEPILKGPLRPHVVVESSPGRFHCYWMVSNCSKEDFTRIQKALAKIFKADEQCIDLARVMRLPGFFHQKHEPHLTNVKNGTIHD